MKMHSEKYQSKLLAMGCQLIGGGLYSKVYSIPNSNLAFKIGGLDRWSQYVKWATENGWAGNYAPKVHALKFYNPTAYDGFYVAIMERLVCTIRETRYSDDGRYLATSSHHAAVFAEMSDWTWRKPDGAEPETSELYRFIRELRENNLCSDMHEGNVMIRSDGSLVVTDPACGNSTETFRIKRGEVHA